MQGIYQKYGKKALAGIAIFSLIYIVGWSALVSFLPSGWWVTAINIILWTGSFIFIGLGPLQTLKVIGMSDIKAGILSVLFWGGFVIGIRSVLLSIFGA